MNKNKKKLASVAITGNNGERFESNDLKELSIF